MDKIDQMQLVVCVKDTEARVLYQNDSCRKLCGSVQGQTCNQGCMSHFKDATPLDQIKKGIHHLGSKLINGLKFDVVIANDDSAILSILAPVESETLSEELANTAFTKREREVLRLKCQEGLSASEICKQLFISKPTLKTHINNINNKLRAKNRAAQA